MSFDDPQTGALPERKLPEVEGSLDEETSQLKSKKPQSEAVPLKVKKNVGQSPKLEGSGQAPPEKTKRLRASNKRRRDWGWWIGGFMLGFAIGLALSLTYGWVLDPRPQATTPADLRAQDKEFYLRLIALAFYHDKNEGQARARLLTLG